MSSPNQERIDALLERLRGQLIESNSFEVSELRPAVTAGYQQDAPGEPKYADHATPVLVVTIAISTLSDEEHRRQLDLPPNPRHQRAAKSPEVS